MHTQRMGGEQRKKENRFLQLFNSSRRLLGDGKPYVYARIALSCTYDATRTTLIIAYGILSRPPPPATLLFANETSQSYLFGFGSFVAAEAE